MQITRRSPLTHKITTMDLDITHEQITRWQVDHELIQNVMPDLTPDEREFIMTGYTAEDWKAMFPPEPPQPCEGCGGGLSDYEIDNDLVLCRGCRAETEDDERSDLAREARYENE